MRITLKIVKMNMKKYFIFTIIMSISNTTYAISNKRFELLSGVKKVKDKQTFWNKAYGKKKYIYGKAASNFLSQNFLYLPKGGTILDMGMGEGRNAVFLAQNGFKVMGVDISKIAVKKAQLLAREKKVQIKTITASLNKYDFKENSFDGIIIFYYVDRSLIPKIYKWLKPGGILIYRGYTKRQRRVIGFENEKKEYLLDEGELLTLFPGMKVLKFEEPLHFKKYTSSAILLKK